MNEEQNEKKGNPITKMGVRLFGNFFNGFMKTDACKPFIEGFKEFYFKKRLESDDRPPMELVKEYNELFLYPDFKAFHPYPATVAAWSKRWDYDIYEKVKNKVITVDSKNKYVEQLLITRDNFNELIAQPPSDSSLEAATRTLAGELVNDALNMLKQDQGLEEAYDDEVIVKRRNYILNVLARVTTTVQGKQALILKASEEKRNTAGFLMDLLAKASAGTITPEEMDLLKSSYNNPTQDVQN